MILNFHLLDFVVIHAADLETRPGAMFAADDLVKLAPQTGPDRLPCAIKKLIQAAGIKEGIGQCLALRAQVKFNLDAHGC